MSKANESNQVSGGKAANRRDFLKVGAASAVGGAAVIGAPRIARAQTVTWTMQSGWPSGDIFHEFA